MNLNLRQIFSISIQLIASCTPTLILLSFHSKRSLHDLPKGHISQSPLQLGGPFGVWVEGILNSLKFKHTPRDTTVPHNLARIQMFPKFNFSLQNINHTLLEKTSECTFLYLITILKQFIIVWLQEHFTYIISSQSTKIFYSELCQEMWKVWDFALFPS